ncbi:hypothetical protein DLU52_09465 [Escherichia coli]|nr:hypothetical protein [Escherichia coli]
MNDNVNENDYYKDKIIFETLAGSQAVRNLSVPEGLINNQMKRKGNILDGMLFYRMATRHPVFHA